MAFREILKPGSAGFSLSSAVGPSQNRIAGQVFLTPPLERGKIGWWAVFGKNERVFISAWGPFWLVRRM